MADRSPTLQRILGAAVVSLGIGMLVLGVSGWLPRGDTALELLSTLLIIVGAVVVAGVAIAFVVTRMAHYTSPASEEDFEATVERSERLARQGPQPPPAALVTSLDALDAADTVADADFEELVAEALDELPERFQEVLARVPVVVSDQGRERHAYGLYHGGTVARTDVADRIVIYRDTLERDFGFDPELLREQVRRTVRHEIAHHLGWDEPGVRRLGL